MPSKSQAQARFMRAAAHNPEFAAKAGIPVSVAKEFEAADQAKAKAPRPTAKDRADKRYGKKG